MGRTIRLSKSDQAFKLCNTIFLCFILLIVLYPLIYITAASFSSPEAVISGRVYLWPVDLSLKGYTAVFENSQVMTGYQNSLFYTFFGTLINLAMTFMAAYPLARRNTIRGSRFILFLFVFTMLFSGGMVPNYVLVLKLKLYNTRWAMLLPGALSIWNLIITRTFLLGNIPEELYEVSAMEGSGEVRTFFQVVLPLSTTIIAVNTLFYAIGHWNAYFNAMIYLNNAQLFPLQIVLRNILIINQVDASMIDIEDLIEREGLKDLLKFSLIVVSSAPVMLIYPFVQRYFVKGIMVGSLKG